MRSIAVTLLIALLGAGMACTASAQISLGPGVFATGGGMISNGTYGAAGSIGQAVIGRSVGPSYAANAGFWGDGAVILGVEPPRPPEIPVAFGLKQNYPNPFNPSTLIGYDVAPSSTAGPGSRVRLVVYDLLGREVAVLVDEEKNPGAYTARLDGNGLATGAYICRMTAGNFVQTRRLMLLK